MNYSRGKEISSELRIERSIPRVMAPRAPEALWPITLGFTLFALWIAWSAGF
jgi:hypothetical protein